MTDPRKSTPKRVDKQPDTGASTSRDVELEIIDDDDPATTVGLQNAIRNSRVDTDTDR